MFWVYAPGYVGAAVTPNVGEATFRILMSVMLIVVGPDTPDTGVRRAPPPRVEDSHLR